MIQGRGHNILQTFSIPELVVERADKKIKNAHTHKAIASVLLRFFFLSPFIAFAVKLMYFIMEMESHKVRTFSSIETFRSELRNIFTCIKRCAFYCTLVQIFSALFEYPLNVKGDISLYLVDFLQFFVYFYCICQKATNI